MITVLKNHRKLLLMALAVVLAIASALVVLEATKPYAVYADGTKVEDPYVVKAGDEELFLVEDARTGEKVIERSWTSTLLTERRSIPSRSIRS